MIQRVIKIGGRVQEQPILAAAIAAEWKRSPTMCIVHGGGAEISRLQSRMGITPVMRDGRRVTTRDDLEIVRMVLSGTANKRLVTALNREGVAAVGVSGEDSALLVATPLDPEAFGYVGTPAAARPELLRRLVSEKYLPVVSPVAVCADPAFSDALNVNGDDSAAFLAGALHVHELLFVSDVPNVTGENGEALERLDADDALELIARGTADGGMAAKLTAARSALLAGTRCVRIGDLAMFADGSAGTMLTQVAKTGARK